jgi:hypothetical protein
MAPMDSPKNNNWGYHDINQQYRYNTGSVRNIYYCEKGYVSGPDNVPCSISLREKCLSSPNMERFDISRLDSGATYTLSNMGGCVCIGIPYGF